MEDIIKVCALGGLDENGRDCYVIEINNDIFVLDAGLALPDKTIPGVDFLLTNACTSRRTNSISLSTRRINLSNSQIRVLIP